MSGFDPNVEPETNEDADAYVGWCAENFMRLGQGQKRTYRTAIRCAQWLLVVSLAQLHLDDDVEDSEPLLEQLAAYSSIARSLERQRQRFPIERLMLMRSSLDCWEPVGVWAEHLLSAAKCALGALMLTELYPLVDLYELSCPDVWVLLASGRDWLAAINVTDELSFADFAIKPDETTIAKFTWQKVNNWQRHMGLPPLSPN